MDYEQKYKHALDLAKQVYDATISEQQKENISIIFPELRESEDERIKKRILLSLEKDLMATKNSGCDTQDLEQCIAWLEKQGNHQKFCDSIQVGDRVTRNEDGVLVNLGQLNRVAKPACEVKPKFKVGDWVVGTNNVFEIISLNEELNCYIAVTSNNEEVKIPYYFDDEQGHMCSYRLWTIPDAKKGDIVCAEPTEGWISPFIAICKRNELITFDSYCFVDFNGDFNEGLDGHDSDNIHPATKEQRDLLFQKMHEAGYEWDAKNKELKKIHIIDEGKAEMDYCFTKMMNNEKVSSIWTEEDEKKRNLLISILEVNHPNGYFKVNPVNTLNMEAMSTEELVNWLKSLDKELEDEL